MKAQIAVAGFALSVVLAVAQTNTPSRVGMPPSGYVTQSISKSTVVTPDKLDPSTRIGTRTIPPGLTLICRFYGAADEGNPAYNNQAECPLAVGAKLDTSYRQGAFSQPCSGGGAFTPITLADIPQGIHIEFDGGYYWAVIPPIRLEALQFDNSGNVIQWGVHVNNLYCGPGSGTNGGCNVKLDIYAKLK